MTRESVDSKVKTLETRVTMLEELPARMDRLESQIVQLRAENSAEHSAMREEIRAQGAELRGEMKGLRTELRGEMKALRTELREEMQALGGDLRTTMEALHERQGTLARTLFEEALGRIAAMNEARPSPRDPNA